MYLKADEELFISNTEPQLLQGTQASVVLRLQINNGYRGAYIALYIHDQARNPVITFPVRNHQGEAVLFKPGGHAVEIPLGPLDLNSGKYSLAVGVRDADSAVVMAHAEGFAPFRICADWSPVGKIVRPVVPSLLAAS